MIHLKAKEVKKSNNYQHHKKENLRRNFSLTYMIWFSLKEKFQNYVDLEPLIKHSMISEKYLVRLELLNLLQLLLLPVLDLQIMEDFMQELQDLHLELELLLLIQVLKLVLNLLSRNMVN